MKYKIPLIVLLLLLIPLVVTVAIALASGAVQGSAQTQASLLPSQPFTYQGELLDGDQPEPGPCDFQFGLWDALSLGSQVGLTQTLNSVSLDAGRFTVILNADGQIGASPFDGQALWLAINVGCPASSGGYISLTPRQQLTAAPYAHFSTEASYVPWSGITSMPDGFSDGVDDDTQYVPGTGLELVTTTFHLEESYRLPQTCAPNQLAESTGTTWGCYTPYDGGSVYANVVVVAKSGGDYDTVQGALDSITDMGPDNPYLVWVAPGVYTETVVLKPYVQVEGAGQNLTKIQSAGVSSSGHATVESATHSSLRSLTVENFGQGDYAIAILADSDDFTISDVAVICSGGTTLNWGINVKSLLPLVNTVQDTTIRVNDEGSSSGSLGFRINPYSGGAIGLNLDHVEIVLTGSASTDLRGIYQIVTPDNGSSVITATNVTISAINTGSGAGRGIYSYGPGSSFNIADSRVYASGGGSSNYGMLVGNGATAIARNITLEASYTGLHLVQVGDLHATAYVDGSKIVGGTHSVRSIGANVNVVNIGSSLLDGLIVYPDENPVVCVASYDENYTNIAGFTGCP